MRICILAAGAGGMYCGSCLRDNALAKALLRAGHEVTLVPLYTPLRTDAEGLAIKRVFYGGINTYLQYALGIFRRTPRAVDWLLDRPWLLNLAGQAGAQTSPSKLGPFTLSILQGQTGPQRKELLRLAEFLKTELKPQVVSLPNLMFIGAAQVLSQEVGVPVVCELTGEDIFLDALTQPYRDQARQLIRQRVADVAQFVATSRYYARRMSDYLQVAEDRIAVAYPGVSRDFVRRGDFSPSLARPTVGYLARICPEKGLDRLVEAFSLLRKMPGMQHARLRVAGYLGGAHRRWFEALRRQIQSQRMEQAVEYVGEVDLAGKLSFLDGLDVLSVPTAYAEPKGLYLLEAMARGVPVIQPDHGAFSELIAQTGGGVLVPPGDAPALALALAQLLADGNRRRMPAERGRAAVAARFTDDHMAMEMLEIYKSVL